jgi:dTDP-glucose 4,6-dehydratase
MKTKILITGANGFVGTHLVDELSKDKNNIIFKLPHQVLHQGDQLKKLIKEANPDVIYNLAAFGNMANQQENTGEIINANLIGTWNLLAATKDIPYRAFINISTSSVLLPHQTIYSATKHGAEDLCKAFVDEYHKPIVTVRPFSLYGIGEADFRFIPTVFDSCMNSTPMNLSPHACHDWTFIDDFIQAIIFFALDIDNKKGQAINVGTSIATENFIIVDLIEQITKKRCVINELKDFRSFDNINWHAIGEDWLCDTSLAEGLNKIYKCYTKN